MKKHLKNMIIKLSRVIKGESVCIVMKLKVLLQSI
jgi:hypothetical protein